MMAAENDWTCDVTSALNISLVRASSLASSRGNLETVASFSPEFTYSIFGDEETVFGYKGLKMHLQFAAHDLRPNLQVQFDEEFTPVDDVKPTDIKGLLKDFMTEETFDSSDTFAKSIYEDKKAKDFVPPGQQVLEYSNNGKRFEVWAGSLADPEVRRLFGRVQVLIPLFIDDGKLIETNDLEWTLSRWTVYFIYEYIEQLSENLPRYSFIGFATTYKWYFFQPTTAKQKQSDIHDENFQFPVSEAEMSAVDDLSCRLRISQFIILPPYKSKGHGSHLYQHIRSHSVATRTISELTVELPNEPFDILRDINDYQLMQKEFSKHNVTINPDPYAAETNKKRPLLVPTSILLPVETLDELRTKFKITPIQFSHLLEMYLLSQIPASHRETNGANMARLLVHKHHAANVEDRRYYWWRILVKQRLYKQHVDVLKQLSANERVEKLDETVHNVEEGYEVLFQMLENGGRLESSEPEQEGRGGLKRKHDDDDDDDDDDDANTDDEDEDPGENGSGDSSADILRDVGALQQEAQMLLQSKKPRT